MVMAFIHCTCDSAAFIE